MRTSLIYNFEILLIWQSNESGISNISIVIYIMLNCFFINCFFNKYLTVFKNQDKNTTNFKILLKTSEKNHEIFSENQRKVKEF